MHAAWMVSSAKLGALRNVRRDVWHCREARRDQRLELFVAMSADGKGMYACMYVCIELFVAMSADGKGMYACMYVCMYRALRGHVSW